MPIGFFWQWGKLQGSGAATDFKPFSRAPWQESRQVQSSTTKEVKNSPQKSRQRSWQSGSGQTRGVQEGEVNVTAHVGLKSPRPEDTDVFEYSHLSYSNEAAFQVEYHSASLSYPDLS